MMRYSTNNDGQRWGSRLALGLTALLIGSWLAAEENDMELTLTSTAFAPGGAIPRRYTCEGEDISPQPASVKTRLVRVCREAPRRD